MQRRDRKGCWFSAALGDRRVVLRQLQQKRAEVLAQLNGLLEGKQDGGEQAAQRSAAEQTLQSLTAYTEQRQAEVAQVKELVEAQRKTNQARRVSLNSRATQLNTARLSVAPLVLPQELRTHEMAVLHAWLGLLGEQRHKLAQLLEILPLRVSGLRSAPTAAIETQANSSAASGAGSQAITSTGSSGALGPPSNGPTLEPTLSSGSQAGSGISVSLCGLKLPDRPVGRQSEQQAKSLSAVLGYVHLLLDLAAAYLGAPLLHEGTFMGSRSVVWERASYWTRQPTDRQPVLPTYIESGMVASAMDPLNLSSKGKSAVAGTAASWMGLPLLRQLTGTQASSAPGAASTSASIFTANARPDSAGSSASGTDDALGSGKKNAAFGLAFEMLQRSCLCLVRHCAMALSHTRGELQTLPNALAAAPLPTQGARPGAPPHWQGGAWPGQLGLPAKLSASMAKSHGTSNSHSPSSLPLPSSWSAWGCLVVLCAAILQEDSESGPAPVAASKFAGVLPAASLAVHSEESATPSYHVIPNSGLVADEEAEEEGWDVVHTVLPPPPSSDDVEQYARAMFTDGNVTGTSAGPSTLQGASSMGSGAAALGTSPLPRANVKSNRGSGAGAQPAGLPLGLGGGGSGVQLSSSPGSASPLGLSRLGSMLRGTPRPQ